MSKIKIKQINSDGQPSGAVLTRRNGSNVWSIPLLGELPDDGSWTDSRLPGRPPAVGLSEETPVNVAIDNMNEILGLLLPEAPTNFAGAALNLDTDTSPFRVVSGVTTNGNTDIPGAGTTVRRGTTATLTTNTTDARGDGTSGELTLWVNEQQIDNFTFTSATGNSKSTGVLRVGSNNWTVPNGFFQTFTANGTGVPMAVGLNRVQIRHSVSGNSVVAVAVRDDLTTLPVTTGVGVTTNTVNGVTTSGVTHFGTNAVVNITATVSGLAGQTYANSNILQMRGPGADRNFDHGQGGLPATLPANFAPFELNQTFTISGNTQSINAKVDVAGANPNGTGTRVEHSENLLVLSGTGGVREPTITGLATTSRIYLTEGTGDTPSNLAFDNWNVSQDLSAAGFEHEAAIVGGVIRRDLNNYSTGHLPAGNPNYSSKSASQYVTYRFQLSARSNMRVVITGSYAGLWVALPGISTNSELSPNALGGAWWDAFASYNGSGIPGRAGDAAAGCAAGSPSTGNGPINITFGTASSTNSTGNAILVRVKLNAGQSISAISITNP